jgi:hypothetical protein
VRSLAGSEKFSRKPPQGETQWPMNLKKKLSLEELMVSTLAMTDALAKLLIEKGVITDEEFKAKLSTERANYLAVLKRMQ